MKRTIVKLMLVAMMIVASIAGQALAQAEKAPGKAAKQGYLGVSIASLSADDRSELKTDFGVLVTHVEKGLAADNAGIKRDDVIQYVNGEKIRRPDALSEIISELPASSQAKIKLLRDGKTMELSATLGERADDDEDVPFVLRSPKLKSLHKRGAYLGVQLRELSADLASYFNTKANGGALILAVEKKSPAQKAELKEGDVIVKIGTTVITSPGSAQEALHALKGGEKVAVTVLRHGKEKTIDVELEEQLNFRFFELGEGRHELPEFIDHIMPRIKAIESAAGCYIIHNINEIKENHKELLEKVKIKVKKAGEALKELPKTSRIRIYTDRSVEV